MRIGRAYTICDNWFVETEKGVELEVVNGDCGSLHSVLRRGQDENKRVYFREENGKAHVLEIVWYAHPDRPRIGDIISCQRPK